MSILPGFHMEWVDYTKKKSKSQHKSIVFHKKHFSYVEKYSSPFPILKPSNFLYT